MSVFKCYWFGFSGLMLALSIGETYGVVAYGVSERRASLALGQRSEQAPVTYRDSSFAKGSIGSDWDSYRWRRDAGSEPSPLSACAEMYSRLT